MPKRKPPQPNPVTMLVYHRGNHHSNHSSSESSESSELPPRGFADEHHWSSAQETNASYARLSNSLRDFVYGISRGYSVRHACRMSGEDYERMLDYLNHRDSRYKPELLRLVEKARAVAAARHIEKLNASPDWHAAAFWLERRERREFAPPHVRVEDDSAAEGPRALIRMSPETLDALSAAYDAEHGNSDEERKDA